MGPEDGRQDAARAPGRPRDDAAGPSLLAAARRLVIRHGYRDVSVQMITAEAGVGRQTLYRRWSSKAELVLDAFLESAGRSSLPGEGSVAEILRRFLEDLFVNLEQDGPAIRSLIAAAQEDSFFLERFRVRFVQPRAAIVAKILQDAATRGELAPDADIDAAIAAFHGAFWYRLLLGEVLDPTFAASLVTLLLHGLAAKPA